MRILVVSTSSTTRALLGSLLGAVKHQVTTTDSLTAALERIGPLQPEVVILQAEIARAAPDALKRLGDAVSTPVGFVLADRAYLDERRGSGDVQALGAQVFVPLPPEAAALEEAVNAAARGLTGGARSPLVSQSQPEERAGDELDDQQFARYAERLFTMLGKLDAYQLLGVGKDADQDSVVAAFRKRAMDFHPDRPRDVGDETREHIYQIFKRVSWAFRQVGDPDSRRNYDRRAQG